MVEVAIVGSVWSRCKPGLEPECQRASATGINEEELDKLVTAAKAILAEEDGHASVAAGGGVRQRPTMFETRRVVRTMSEYSCCEEVMEELLKCFDTMTAEYLCKVTRVCQSWRETINAKSLIRALTRFSISCRVLYGGFTTDFGCSNWDHRSDAFEYLHHHSICHGSDGYTQENYTHYRYAAGGGVTQRPTILETNAGRQ